MRFVAALAFSAPEHFVDVARTADTCGWHAVAVSDHVLFPRAMASVYPYSPDGMPLWSASTPWPDPLIAIGAMSAVTTRLRFWTNVYVLPARNPFLVAKAVATAAVLSNNRVTLGIGAGWMREEFELLGQEFRTRGARTDEAIEMLRVLWQGGMVSYHGRFYRFDAVEMSPAPTRQVPIYVGGESTAALRRAARYGDGWISVLHTTEELRALIGRLRAYRRQYGRIDAPFDVCVSSSDAFDLDGYRRLQDLGVTTVLTVPWVLYGDDPTHLDSKRRGLERFAADVIVRFT